MRVLYDVGNVAVVHREGRAFPAVAVQGDTFEAIAAQLRELQRSIPVDDHILSSRRARSRRRPPGVFRSAAVGAPHSRAALPPRDVDEVE